METEWNEWRTGASAMQGDDYPIGSVAVLANPQPVDTGLYSSGRTASRFVKRSAGGGRWVSYPGSDIYFNTLGDLQLALTESGNEISELIVPDAGDTEEEVTELSEEGTEAARNDLDPWAPVEVEAEPGSRGKFPWKWLALGVGAIWLLGRK